MKREGGRGWGWGEQLWFRTLDCAAHSPGMSRQRLQRRPLDEWKSRVATKMVAAMGAQIEA